MKSLICILCKVTFHLFVLTFFTTGFCSVSSASEVVNIPILADAIRKAEGNPNYGVLSIPCKTEAKCRQICINSIKNNLKRYEKSDKSIDFISFMAKRWAPVGAKNDPKNLNANWIRNTTFHYERILKSKCRLKSFTKCKAQNIKRGVL